MAATTRTKIRPSNVDQNHGPVMTRTQWLRLFTVHARRKSSPVQPYTPGIDTNDDGAIPLVYSAKNSSVSLAYSAKNSSETFSARNSEENMRRASVGELISNLKAADVRVKKSIDDGSAATTVHTMKAAVLTKALSHARLGAEHAGEAVEDMLESFRVMQHKSLWMKGLDRLQHMAAAEDVTVQKLSHQACCVLEDGEPGGAEHSAAVLLLQQSAAGEPTLSVCYATPEAIRQSNGRMKPSAVWSSRSSHPLCKEAFEVLRTGRELLRSPFGTFPGASLAPLAQKDGRVFGVLISGPAARPDELVHRTARLVGPLIERAWKRAAATALGRLGAQWVRQNADSETVTDVCFVPMSVDEEKSGKDEWSPLPHHYGAALRRFSMPMYGMGGDMVGTLNARVREHCQLDSSTLTLFHATGQLLQEQSREISEMLVGHATKINSLNEMRDHYSTGAATHALAAELQEQITKQLIALEPNKLIAEMRGYPTPDATVKQVLQGVLSLVLGRSPKTMQTWDDVKKLLSSQLTKDLLALDVADGKKGWLESARATKSLNVDALLDEAPLPVAAMLRWLIAVRLVREVAVGGNKAPTVATAVEVAGKALANVSPRRKGQKKKTDEAGQLSRLPGAERARMRIAAAVRKKARTA